MTNPRSRFPAWNGGLEALPQVNLKGGRAVETRYFQNLSASGVIKEG
jgi:hypothetical protein